MPTLVDAKYFGQKLRTARHTLRIPLRDMRQLLRVTTQQLHRYENGRDIMPDDMLNRIFTHGVMAMRLKHHLGRPGKNNRQS